MSQSDIYLSFLALASVGVWLLIVYRLVIGSAPLPYRQRPHVVVEAPAVFSIALLYLAIPLVLFSVWKPPPDPSLMKVHIHITLSLLFLAIAVPLFRDIPKWLGGSRLRPADLGIDTRDLMYQLRDGLLAFFASQFPAWMVAWSLVELKIKTPETQHDLLKLLTSDPSPVTVWWVVLAVVVVAPLVEEFLFRVVIQEWLLSYLPPSVAIVIVAVLFCLVHRFPDSLALFPLAVILGYVYYRRHSFLAVFVMHALFNAANLVLLALSVRE